MEKSLITMQLLSNKYKRIFQLMIITSLVIQFIPSLFGLEEFLGAKQGEMSKISQILLLLGAAFLMITKDKNDDEMLFQIRLKSIVLSIFGAVGLSIAMIIVNDKSWGIFQTLVFIFLSYFISYFIRKNKA